jgi:hypothetical protein
MPFYEYKVVPAPDRATKVKGLRGAPLFAHGLESLMNELAQDGWEYLRAESLPDEEKKGLMGGRETVIRNILVFRRELYFEEAADPVAAVEDAPAPLTLSRRTEPEAPPRAPEPPEMPPETTGDSDLDRIYAGAEMDPDEPAPARPDTPQTRRPLVADRKGQGVDF